MRFSPERAAVFDLLEGGLPCVLITARTQSSQAFDLFAFQRFVDTLDGDGFFFLHRKTIYPDHHRLLAIDLLLVFICRILDFLLHVAAFEGFDHATQSFNLSQIVGGAGFNFIGQGLDVVGAGQRVNGLGDPGLISDDLLGTQRDAGGLLGRQRERLIVRNWCEATGCRRAPRPAPAARCGRCCFPVAGRSASNPRSGCGSAASTNADSSP